MYGIREIILTVGDRILGVVLILALITCTRNPDNSLETLLANHIHHRLEVIMQCFIRIRSITQMNPHRLVGKFDGDQSRVLLDILISSKSFPYSLQIAIIFVVNADVARADARWTNDDVKPMSDGILNQWNIKFLEI